MTREQERAYAKAMGYDADGNAVDRERDLAAQFDVDEEPLYTAYERSMERQWKGTCSAEELARRVNALRVGRLAAIKKARAATQKGGA